MVGFTSKDNKVNDYPKNTVQTIKKNTKKKKKKFVRKRVKTERELKIEELSKITGLNVKDYEEVECSISFYTSLPSENGGYDCTAQGLPLEYGIVANNVLPFGTNIYFEGMDVFTVKDRGAKSVFSTKTRYDMLIPRNYGESDGEYLARVNNMGKKFVTSYILYE